MAILVVAIRTMKTATSPLEEISTLDDYEMSVPGGILSSGSLPEMPPLPSSDEVANSMYGGSREIFNQPPPPIHQAEESDASEEETPDENLDVMPPARIGTARGLDYGTVGSLWSEMVRPAG